jgi:hypothetical protein
MNFVVPSAGGGDSQPCSRVEISLAARFLLSLFLVIEKELKNFLMGPRFDR